MTSDAAPLYSNDLPRLVVCSSGFYPSVAIHAAFLIGMELCTQVQEEDGLCPAPLRPDLLSVLEDAKAWCLRVIKAGETNVKGYLLMSMISARVEGTDARPWRGGGYQATGQNRRACWREMFANPWKKWPPRFKSSMRPSSRWQSG